MEVLPLQVFKALKGGVSEVAVKEMCCIDVSQMHAFENEVALLQSLTFDRNIVQVGALLEGTAVVGEQPADAAAASCLSVTTVLPAVGMTQHRTLGRQYQAILAAPVCMHVVDVTAALLHAFVARNRAFRHEPAAQI